MKIITWNLERLKKKSNLSAILEILRGLDADILILTETHSLIDLGEGYTSVCTKSLYAGYDGIPYKEGETRVTIWSKFPVLKSHDTFDEYTSVCADLDTPEGILRIYGTIIGVFGGTNPRFTSDLNGQLDDFKKLFTEKKVCLVGDLNTTFIDRVYPSHKARETLNDFFDKYSLINLTASITENVDHIIISKSFIEGKEVGIETWNSNKSLSDHKGIAVNF